MQSAPTDVLDVLADILPFHLLVKQHRKQAALRLATLPETHPLSKPVMSAARRFVKAHMTPLHHLMRELGRDPATLETIGAVRQMNKWKAAFTTEIEEKTEDAEAVELQDREDQAGVRVYTDGSGLGGEIGAAAVLYRGDTEKGQLRYCLGTAEEHTVYEGECVGILLGLELIKRQRNMRKVTMYIDSQAAIQATMSNKPAPGHYLLDEVHKQYGALQKIHGNMEMVIWWSPGHVGIPGNEAADKAARKAAEGQVTTLRRLPRLLHEELPHSKSAARQTDRRKLKEVAATLWKRSTRYTRINYLVPGLPRQSYFRAIAKLPRKHTSIITQIVTGHMPLAKHLHRINKADSPICPCCHEHEETVAHFVLHCPTNRTARAALFEGTPHADRNLPQLLATEEARARLLNFIAHTTRLRSVFGDIPLVDDT